jgi:hypothetical protein
MWLTAECSGTTPNPGFAGMSGRSGTYVRENFNLDPEDSLEERIRSVYERALDELQDFVDETSTEPWPGVHTIPPAHAEVRGSMVYLWYGDAAAHCAGVPADRTPSRRPVADQATQRPCWRRTPSNGVRRALPAGVASPRRCRQAIWMSPAMRASAPAQGRSSARCLAGPPLIPSVVPVYLLAGVHGVGR